MFENLGIRIRSAVDFSIRSGRQSPDPVVPTLIMPEILDFFLIWQISKKMPAARPSKINIPIRRSNDRPDDIERRQRSRENHLHALCIDRVKRRRFSIRRKVKLIFPLPIFSESNSLNDRRPDRFAKKLRKPAPRMEEAVRNKKRENRDRKKTLFHFSAQNPKIKISVFSSISFFAASLQTPPDRRFK